MHKPMSAKCQKRTFRHSFDHLVGGGEQIVRNCKADALAVLRLITSSIWWLLYRQVRGIDTSQNLVDIDGAAAP